MPPPWLAANMIHTGPRALPQTAAAASQTVAVRLRTALQPARALSHSTRARLSAVLAPRLRREEEVWLDYGPHIAAAKFEVCRCFILILILLWLYLYLMRLKFHNNSKVADLLFDDLLMDSIATILAIFEKRA